MEENSEGSRCDQQEAENEDAKCCFCLDTSGYRFVAMGVICLSGFALIAIYDMPGSIEIAIETTFKIPTYEFEYLYSLYSLPNIVLSFFNGVLLDKVFGVRLGILFLTTVALLAQIVITAGAFAHLFWLMILGRFFLGIGLESTLVAINCFAILWFKGKELNFLFGLYQSVARLGSSFVFLIAPMLYSFAERTVAKSNVLGIQVSPTLLITVILILFSAFLGQFSLKCGKEVGRSKSETNLTAEFKEILKFPIVFWLIIMLIAIYISVVYAFISCSQQLLATKYDITGAEANNLTGTFTIVGAVMAPVIGLITDKTGKELTINLIGIILGIVSSVFIVCTEWSPYALFIIFALGFSILNSCTWPLVSYVIKDYQLGAAYGALASLMNLVLTLSNYLAGLFLGTYGPVATMIFFLALLIVCLAIILAIWVIDSRNMRVLNLSSKQRRIQQENV